MVKKPKVSVILSTYNNVEWLKKSLFGYANQIFEDFELLVADDGSDELTNKLLSELSPLFRRPILHIWHEDLGFRKTIILNKAIKASTADYIIMSDGDCIPRQDFVLKHIQLRKSNCFLSGGYVKLPLSISKEISLTDIENQNCFDKNWLRKSGLKGSFKNKKITATGIESKLLNLLTPTKATWNGHNSSCWKKDILEVNGFDERMQYGGEDREMGERLLNNKLKAKQIRYSAICVHLDHERGYVKKEMLLKNSAIRKETRLQKKIVTEYGIIKRDSLKSL